MKKLLPTSNSLKIYLCVLLALLTTFSARAQFFDHVFNPTVTVNIQHPPSLGIKTNKVAFGPASGNCSDEIADGIQSDFVANNITVVDRQNISNILAEHHFSLSGYADRKTTAAIGKILGPSVLIFVKTYTCTTTQDKLYDTESRYDSKTKSNYSVTVYYARTRAVLNAEIKTVDLTTGVLLQSQTFNYSPEKKNKSEQGYPEFPADFELAKAARQMMIDDVHKLFLPWTEQRALVFYDDSKGNLKQAFQALKVNDIDRALELSKQNVDGVKSLPKANEKLLGRAYYNLGMAYMLKDDYDNALVNFKESAKIKSGDIIEGAIADCEKAKALSTSIKQIDQNAAIEANKNQVAMDKANQEEAANTLTNNDVIKLSKQKLPASIIIHKIKLSKCNFNTKSDDLVALTKSGVNEKVIMAMMEKTQE